MPELPEVETVRRGLAPYLEGVHIASVDLNRPGLRRPFAPDMAVRLGNTRCTALHRRGKYILAVMESGDTLVIHLGMSGRLLINPPHAMRHDHVVIRTVSGNRIVYNDPRRFGDMVLLKSTEVAAWPPFAAMGPEPLGPGFTGGVLSARLQGRKTTIKAALMDQRVVAGVGNIYACEALYHAGISPLRRADTVKGVRAQRLADALQSVLAQAIEAGGSSLRDYRRIDGEIGGYQDRFAVYGRAGDICAISGGEIKRIVQNGRSTFYCPARQR